MRALLTGHEVLEGGHALRRANGAVFLDGGATAAGPLQRRAEMEATAHEEAEAQTTHNRAVAAPETTMRDLAQAEGALAE